MIYQDWYKKTSGAFTLRKYVSNSYALIKLPGGIQYKSEPFGYAQDDTTMSNK